METLEPRSTEIHCGSPNAEDQRVARFASTALLPSRPAASLVETVTVRPIARLPPDVGAAVGRTVAVAVARGVAVLVARGRDVAVLVARGRVVGLAVGRGVGVPLGTAQRAGAFG